MSSRMTAGILLRRVSEEPQLELGIPKCPDSGYAPSERNQYPTGQTGSIAKGFRNVLN